MFSITYNLQPATKKNIFPMCNNEIYLNSSYAPWCPACKNLRPTWENFAVEAETLNVRVAEVDVTKSTGCVYSIMKRLLFIMIVIIYNNCSLLEN